MFLERISYIIRAVKKSEIWSRRQKAYKEEMVMIKLDRKTAIEAAGGRGDRDLGYFRC